MSNKDEWYKEYQMVWINPHSYPALPGAWQIISANGPVYRLENSAGLRMTYAHPAVYR